MAERVGFEPTILRIQDSGFRDRRLQPLGHLSVSCILYCLNVFFQRRFLKSYRIPRPKLHP
jgi:hypothetical protein